MVIVFVSNIRKKGLIILAIVSFWISMFLLADFFFHNSLTVRITINRYLEFSCPSDIQVNSVLVNGRLPDAAVETSSMGTKLQTGDFSSYKSLQGKFSFEYPSAFTINPMEFEDSEVLYHIDFHDREHIVHGFVQVWQMPYPLSQFLQNSKNTSQLTYKDFKESRIKVNDLPGYLWDYIVLGSDSRYYKGMEAFLEKGGQMYRVSVFAPEDQWDEKLSETFWRIVKSLKTYS